LITKVSTIYDADIQHYDDLISPRKLMPYLTGLYLQQLPRRQKSSQQSLIQNAHVPRENAIEYIVAATFRHAID
jgi:hypothetical protein